MALEDLADAEDEKSDKLVAAEQDRLFGLYGKVHGPEAKTSFEKLAAAGVDVDAIEALEGCGFGIADPEAGAAAVDDGKAQILANLEDDDAALDSNAKGSGAGDFMSAVDALVEEKKITKVEAMKSVAKSNPDLYEAYLSGRQ